MFSQSSVTPTVQLAKMYECLLLTPNSAKSLSYTTGAEANRAQKKIYFENPPVAFVRNLLPTIFQTKVLSPSPFLGYRKLTNPNMRSNTGCFNVQL